MPVVPRAWPREGVMADYPDYEGSGLELVHVGDVLDYLGRYLTQAVYTMYCPGVTEPRQRLVVRNSILYPGKATASLQAGPSGHNYQEAFYILLGATAMLVVFSLIAFISCTIRSRSDISICKFSLVFPSHVKIIVMSFL